jgi:hypothetical protein
VVIFSGVNSFSHKHRHLSVPRNDDTTSSSVRLRLLAQLLRTQVLLLPAIERIGRWLRNVLDPAPPQPE